MKRTDYYSPKQAAAEIICSETFVYRLLREGILPDYRIGNRHLILVSAVEDYIEKTRTKEKQYLEEHGRR